jgi:hypothetical protein
MNKMGFINIFAKERRRAAISADQKVST